MKKVAIWGEQLAAIHMTQILAQSSFEVHYSHPEQNVLTQVAGNGVTTHRTTKQMLTQAEFVILMDDNHLALEQIPNHVPILYHIGQADLPTIMGRMQHERPIILFHYSLGNEVATGHTLLASGKSASQADCDFAEKCMRLCGSVQWAKDASSLKALATASGCLPMLTLIVLDSITQYLRKQGVSEPEATLLVKATLLGDAKLIHHASSGMSSLLSHACDYLQAKQSHLAAAQTLSAHHFDKTIVQALLDAEQGDASLRTLDDHGS